MHSDEIKEKSYDSNLMRRMLKYAKPYWHYLLLTIVLMMLVTALELLRPYLFKITIDDYINGYKKPMVEVELDEDVSGVEFNGKKIYKIKKIIRRNNDKFQNSPLKTIEKKDGKYYLIDLEPDEDSRAIALSKADYENFRKQDVDGLTKIGLVFLLAVIIAFVFNYLQVYILNYTSQRIIFNIRKDVYSHIQSLSISYFDKNPVGRLVTRVTNDTETLNEMYTSVLVSLFKDIFILAGIIIVMLKMNYKLALLSFSLIPLILLASILFRKKRLE